MEKELLQEILNELKQGQQKINLRLSNIETRLDNVDTEINVMKLQLDRIENKISNIPLTYEQYEKHVKLQDKKINVLNQRILNIEAQLQV
jgi:predicted  nucleic acid-binding Zn-ribbon protein